ncbi:CRISPR system Cascade subunit CasD [uncultured bacterium]|nr:CRISPR system Cascade subunit CasD [uncultured bacterium]
MPDFLILKLQGAMQAWGGHTYEDYRPSLIFPTRSAVVGLLGACLGIEREKTEQLKDLNDSFKLTVLAHSRQVENGQFKNRRFKLTDGVFAKLRQKNIMNDDLNKLAELKNQEIQGEDKFLSTVSEKIGNEKIGEYKKLLLKEATLKRIVSLHKITDYHTVLDARRSDGGKRDDAIVSRREYLCDAEFTLALAFNTSADLERIVKAIKKPIYTPYLGRRSCPLQRPLFEKIITADNAELALKQIENTGTLYSETPLENQHTLQIRDLPMFETKRRFLTRPVHVKGG